MKATAPGGKLNPIPNCTITIGGTVIQLKALPEIDDNKQANYDNEDGIGRTQPFLTYRSSGFRTIGLNLHFYVTASEDIDEIWGYIRALQSTVYPNPGDPYSPPSICQIQCGDIFQDVNGDHICAVCTSCGVKYGTETAWYKGSYLPCKVDINTSWYVTYANSQLPGADQILALGSTGGGSF